MSILEDSVVICIGVAGGAGWWCSVFGVGLQQPSLLHFRRRRSSISADGFLSFSKCKHDPLVLTSCSVRVPLCNITIKVLLEYSGFFCGAHTRSVLTSFVQFLNYWAQPTSIVRAVLVCMIVQIWINPKMSGAFLLFFGLWRWRWTNPVKTARIQLVHRSESVSREDEWRMLLRMRFKLYELSESDLLR